MHGLNLSRESNIVGANHAFRAIGGVVFRTVLLLWGVKTVLRTCNTNCKAVKPVGRQSKENKGTLQETP